MSTLTAAEIDSLEPLLATALQPLPDVLERARLALAMARTVAPELPATTNATEAPRDLTDSR